MITEFARLLQNNIGLDPASIGISSVERAVQLRIAACGAADPATYLHQVRTNAAEMQALIETVVVPETWFFRDPKAFAVVAEAALKSSSKERLHFLCVPSSTGEEPYSLAMALLDAGVRPDRFHIDAIDVSDRVLAIARRGIYGRNSFRGQDLKFRDRYFEQVPEGHRLSPEVRKLVQFHRGNLLDDVSMARGRTYDAIFCRNLLIYFDAETQRRAITALERLLVQDGLLCLGPAETGLLTHFEFTHTRISLAFAFRKGRKQKQVTQKIRVVRPEKKTFVVPVSLPKQSPPPKRSIPAPQVLSAAPNLAEANRLANEGRLAEVGPICEAHIKHFGASADAFHLLGLVRDAEGKVDEAVNCYRKALYLDPRHHDTLLHYSLLTAKVGDAATAAMLRDRARRCAEKAA